jgi:hypothetical protein
MSRSRRIDGDQRRAHLEEELQHALAVGDRERVSELHLLLAEVEGDGEAVGRGRRGEW